ncbi:MAG: quinoprotein relay system zinc metallohydrolase 2 [Candidatus Thiodiazotropha sp.]
MQLISSMRRACITQEILSYLTIPCFRVLSIGIVLFLGVDGLQARTPDVREIAPGIFVRPGIQEEFSTHNHGHIANIGFIVGSERVAVIDTGSSYREGLALRKLIREITRLPIKYVVLTHMHPDHALGAAAFNQDDPVYIGHENLADALARRQSTYLNRMKQMLGNIAEGTQMVFPSQSVGINQMKELDLGGRSLHLHAYPTAHTNNDLSVYDDKTGTLWLSDLLFVERIPVVDGSLLGWLKVIDKLSKQGCVAVSPDEAMGRSIALETEAGGQCGKVMRIVPGHGSVVSQWQGALADQRRYLESIATGIRAIIKQGGTITEAVESVGREEKRNWLLFNDFHGRNVTAVFAELEWE